MTWWMNWRRQQSEKSQQKVIAEDVMALPPPKTDDTTPTTTLATTSNQPTALTTTPLVRVKAKSTKISFLAETYPDHDAPLSSQGLSERYEEELSAHKKLASTTSNKRVGEPHFYSKNQFFGRNVPRPRRNTLGPRLI